MTSETPKGPEQNPDEKSKLQETLDSLKKNEKIEDLFTYAQAHTKDTVAYVLLILGIVWFFFHSFYGGLLIGVVSGFYFTDELMQFLKSVNDLVEEQGIARSLICGGTLLAFFIAAPGIFIGAAIVVAMTQLINPKGSKSSEE